MTDAHSRSHVRATARCADAEMQGYVEGLRRAYPVEQMPEAFKDLLDRIDAEERKREF